MRLGINLKLKDSNIRTEKWNSYINEVSKHINIIFLKKMEFIYYFENKRLTNLPVSIDIILSVAYPPYDSP